MYICLIKNFYQEKIELIKIFLLNHFCLNHSVFVVDIIIDEPIVGKSLILFLTTHCEQIENNDNIRITIMHT